MPTFSDCTSDLKNRPTLSRLCSGRFWASRVALLTFVHRAVVFEKTQKPPFVVRYRVPNIDHSFILVME